MTAWGDLGNIWTTFKELDIRPIRDEAEKPIALAIVGRRGSGKSTLIAAFRCNSHSRDKVITPTIEADLDAAAGIGATDLIVLMLDATHQDYSHEKEMMRGWKDRGQNTIVFFNKVDILQDASVISSLLSSWSQVCVAYGSALDLDSLTSDLIPCMMDALHDRHLALARRYPIFRFAVARELINDTSIANATYSLGTGLAEVIPALDIPFNITDVVILTKNQALMVYKLGLALGLSTRWQDHVAELGGVVGAGFLWRQVARQLVGLIPVWGIVPKVAVAYAGTYAVGEAILRWYQTGHKVSGSGMRSIYMDALTRGKQVAQNLLIRAPHPALPRISIPTLPFSRTKILCPNCNRENPRDAIFCAYCAKPLN